MKTSCSSCGHPLPQMRFFYTTCSKCGTRHRAIRSKGFSWGTALFGALSFVIIPAGFLIPGPISVGFFWVPALYLIGAVCLALRNQQWIAET